MKLLVTLLLAALSVQAFAGSEFETDLTKALDAAKAQNKMLFILYGREKCGNCQATKEMIRERRLRVPASKFVLVDLNCDDAQVSSLFKRHYGGEKFGNTLPFVVVAGPDGAALASGSGYRDAQAWNDAVRDAQKKARPAAGSAGGTTSGGSPDWPFKTAPAGGGR